MDLILNIITNTLDFVMVYALFCGLTDRKLRINIKSVFSIFLWGIFAGVSAEYIQIDVYTLITQVALLIILQILYKKKIYKTFVVLMIINTIIVIIQIPIGLIFSIIPLTEEVAFVSGQVLTIGIIVLVYKKVALNKIEKTIEKKLAIRLCVFLIYFLFLLSVFFYNLSFEEIRVNIFYFAILLVIAAFGFGKTIYEINYYTHKLPILLHETKNAFAAIYFSTLGDKDVVSIRTAFATCMRILGLKFPINDREDINCAEKILALIEYKEQNYSGIKKIIFKNEVDYYESHANVPDVVIVSILAILIDNAMEASKSGKKIKVTVHVTEDFLMIGVGNTFSKERSKVVRLFEKGYTTKEENKELHGHGLQKLKEIVEEYQGEIFAKVDYDEKEKENYLMISAVFKLYVVS